MESNNTLALHMLFNDLPRFDWTMIDQIPYRNGIYVMLEKGESYHSMDRIVRIGTHRGQDRLLKRLKYHFVSENANSSILRKNMGRAFLNMDPSFGPSSNWLGLNSPMPEIARSGLWNSQHLQGRPLSPEELERVKQLARSGSR